MQLLSKGDETEGKGDRAADVKSHADEEWPEKDRVSWRRVSANNDKDENGRTCSLRK